VTFVGARLYAAGDLYASICNVAVLMCAVELLARRALVLQVSPAQPPRVHVPPTAVDFPPAITARPPHPSLSDREAPRDASFPPPLDPRRPLTGAARSPPSRPPQRDVQSLVGVLRAADAALAAESPEKWEDSAIAALMGALDAALAAALCLSDPDGDAVGQVVAPGALAAAHADLLAAVAGCSKKAAAALSESPAHFEGADPAEAAAALRDAAARTAQIEAEAAKEESLLLGQPGIHSPAGVLMQLCHRGAQKLVRVVRSRPGMTGSQYFEAFPSPPGEMERLRLEYVRDFGLHQRDLLPEPVRGALELMLEHTSLQGLWVSVAGAEQERASGVVVVDGRRVPFRDVVTGRLGAASQRAVKAVLERNAPAVLTSGEEARAEDALAGRDGARVSRLCEASPAMEASRAVLRAAGEEAWGGKGGSEDGRPTAPAEVAVAGGVLALELAGSRVPSPDLDAVAPALVALARGWTVQAHVPIRVGAGGGAFPAAFLVTQWTGDAIEWTSHHLSAMEAAAEMLGEFFSRKGGKDKGGLRARSQRDFIATIEGIEQRVAESVDGHRRSLEAGDEEGAEEDAVKPAPAGGAAAEADAAGDAPAGGEAVAAA